VETRHDLGPAYAALAGEGEETWFQPNRMTIKAGREHTAGAYGLLETWVRACSSPPLPPLWPVTASAPAIPELLWNLQ
jgi:hypothetical protein